MIATRGQAAAVARARSMIEGVAPHAVLLAGPGSSGKTTLALDLAAGLLCRETDPRARPCRSCRGCRLLLSGNHPDLHRLAPEGPGGQVRIGKATDPEPGTVRHLISQLALLPAEGGARVAIVEQAHRLNEDAQNALLKLLEEPPAGVTIVLCADDEESLLPTVRSRCVRIRLGSAPLREMEAWLVDLDLADAPAAARLARLAGGRPGLALAYAASPEAVRLRGELARGLLDMLSMSSRERLVAVRELMRSAVALDAALAITRGQAGASADAGSGAGGSPRAASGRRGRGKPPRPGARQAEPAADPAADDAASDATAVATDGTAEAGSEEQPGRAAASGRRAAAATLMAVWSGVARDLAVAAAGAPKAVREVEIADEVLAAAAVLDGSALAGFMDRLRWVEAQSDLNLAPELALDVLALAWPYISHPGSAAGRPGSRK
jgi:DNA polymerase III delta' subunit